MNTAATPAALVVPDLQTGAAMLNRLPLANPAAAELQLLHFLDALISTPPDPADLLALLEQARVPLCFVEEEMARRYHNKPLPLPEIEESCFQQVLEAWRKMSRAYALCAELEEPDHDSPQYAARIATILHRCIYYTGMIILEHYRARRELPPGIWLDLHGYYASAEEWGVASVPVQDSLDHEQQATHCAAAYATLLLIDIASPFSQSVRDLNLIRRWAGMWAPLVSISSPDNEIEIPPFVVELMKDTGLHPTPDQEYLTADVRRLDTSRLALQINQTLVLLRQRIPPSQLGLGEEISSHIIKLMEQLSRPWTQSAAPRKFRRFPTTGKARVGSGFEAMHFLVSNKEFVQPDAAKTYSRDQFDTLFTFRHMADPSQKLTIQQTTDYPCDEWDVINHSANGFRLTRTTVGQKMAHGQLLAVCPHDGQNFLLATASWLMQEQTGGLIAGVAVMPGLPQAVGVRFIAANPAESEPFVRAFLLPPVPPVGEESTLVLPFGTYQASRIMEVAGDSIWQVRLKHIVFRGADFERVSFERI